MPVLTMVVEQCLAAVPGGTGRYTREITAALAAAPPAGWRMRSVTARHRDLGPAVLTGVDGPYPLPLGRRGLVLAWERGAPPWPAGDVVHATTPLAPTGGPFRRAGPVRRRPLVATVHDTVPWTHPETLTTRGAVWHRLMIERICACAAAVVVPTRAVADDLAGRFDLGDRLRVIGHGVTPLPVPDDAATRRRAFGLPETYVLAISTLEPRKGLDVLLPAMAGLDVGLAVVGQPGWGGLDLAKVARSAGVPPGRLHVLGRLPDLDLAAVLAGAAVLAQPSRAEGFGLPMIEAMAAGVPVVHSDISALREVAGGAGLAVPVGDPASLARALGSVLDDAGTAGSLRIRGRARAADFSWSAAAGRTWALYEELAAGPAAGMPGTGPAGSAR